MRWTTRYAMAAVVASSFFGGCNCNAPAPVGSDDGGEDLLFQFVDQAGADLTGAGGDLAGADLSTGGGDASVAPDLAAAIDFAGADLLGIDLASPADLAGADLAGVCVQQTMSCYNGPMGTLGKGVCVAGASQCIAGMFGPCIGEIDPSMESCNGFDDDCNGLVDDGLGNVTCGVGACQVTVAACTGGKPTTCTPKPPGNAEICGNLIDDNCNGLVDEGCNCTYVSPAGDDMKGTGQINAPFRTISKGITAAGSNGLPMTVCVASNAGCGGGNVQTANYAEAITMRDGVAVLGGYSPTVVNNAWVRTAGCITQITDQNAQGVYFGHNVVNPTPIDGFTINGHNDPTAAAVTVAGSTGAQVSNDVITGNGQTTSIGVDITDVNGIVAKPLLLRNAIAGGAAPTSIGVHSLNSAPTITGHCDAVDNAGRCTSDGCFSNLAQAHFIRAGALNANNVVTAWAIQLDNSVGATISQNGICAMSATGNEAAVRLINDGKGVVVTTSRLTAVNSPMNAVGFWADSCKDAAPWLLNNSLIAGTTRLMGGRADGVRAVGNCHVRVDSNLLVSGGQESANNDTNGVYCTSDPQNKLLVSRCTVLGNLAIQGAGVGFPPNSAGVRCDDGACARIEFNLRITGSSGINSYGVVLGNTDTFVNANTIDAGCAQQLGVGLQSNNSFARVQNNAISGSVAGANCQPGATAPSYGVRVVLYGGPNEIDLHSNDVFGEGSIGGACTSVGVGFDVQQGVNPPPPRGIVRNNIITSGQCMIRYNVAEMNAAADPRVLENNDLWTVNGNPTALYRDEAGMNWLTIMQVNALVGDPTAAANINANPGFVNGLHIPMNSPCVDTGTSTGAPLTDYELQTRPQLKAFDIGWDEFKP